MRPNLSSPFLSRIDEPVPSVFKNMAWELKGVLEPLESSETPCSEESTVSMIDGARPVKC